MLRRPGSPPAHVADARYGLPVFRVELLPAAHGDGIWIEYGNAKKPGRLLIDGGPVSTYADGLRAGSKPRLLSVRGL